MTKSVSDLTQLPNIGKNLAEKLKLVGVESSNDLKLAGTENVFIKLVVFEKDICINTLYAIEGAVQGIRWHNISEERKQELREFYAMVNR